MASTEVLPPLRVEGLVKRYGAITAVNDLSLSLAPGECLGLLGPNGAGKTTLIRSIVGRVLPDAGTVRVFEHMATSAAARTGLGWIPQELAIYPRLTCRENLLAFGRYQGVREPALGRAVDWCLEWAALTDRAGEIAGKLSGGMKRRLNMAAGLIQRPRLVLMDEPTVGVDPQSRNRIFEMIEALHAEGVSMIYTTHYMEEAERLCDRIAIVDHGQIIASGSRDQLVHDVFGSRSNVELRFQAGDDAVSAWARASGGAATGKVARLAVESPTAIGGLLDSAVSAGLHLEDVSLRRPNLESVFLQLTGRELRD